MKMEKGIETFQHVLESDMNTGRHMEIFPRVSSVAMRGITKKSGEM